MWFDRYLSILVWGLSNILWNTSISVIKFGWTFLYMVCLRAGIWISCHEIYFGGPVLLTNALKHSVPMTHLDCVCVCPLPTLACRHHSIQIQYRKSGWKEGRTNWEWWGSERERERERDHLTKKYYFFKALGKLSYFRVIYWRKYHNHLVAGSFLYHFVNAPSGSRFEG